MLRYIPTTSKMTIEGSRSVRETEKIDRVIGIIGIAFDVKDLLQEIGILPDKQSEEFEKVLNAIGKNYAAIEKVSDKVDRNFAVMKIVYDLVSKTLSEIEETREEMRQEFKKVLDSLEDLKVGDKISSLATFMDDFNKNVNMINELSADVRVTELERSGGVLETINNAITSDGVLYGNLNHIINQRLAIPKNVNDNIAFAALHIMYYGVQTYVSVLFFELDQYSYLADYYYKRGNVEKCNGFFDILQITLDYFKLRLISNKTKQELIEKVSYTLKEVQQLEFIRNDRQDVVQLIQKRMESLELIIKKITELKLPIDANKPGTLSGKPDFQLSQVKTPLGAWIDEAKVSYAIQCKHNTTYSKIGQWTEPFTIYGKANPTINIPVDLKRRTRFIFRKFNNDKPELVGIIEDKYQTEFRDINRDVYDASLNSNEYVALNEIETLINTRNGAIVNQTFENGRTALHAAAEAGNIQIASYLLNKTINADINLQDNNGYAPIYIAAEAGYDHFVNFLLQKNANVNIRTNLDQLTPLHIAAYKGFESTTNILLNYNQTNINAKDSQNFTPLHTAVFGGTHIIKILTSNAKAVINAKSKDGLTPLHLAAINDYDDVIKILIETNKVDINITAKGNLTALHFASSLGNINTVRFLIQQKGINVNAQTVDSLTPLHLAISAKRDDIALELLKNEKIDVNLKGKGNVTSLHLSSVRGQKDVTLQLVKKGALLEERTRDGLSALHIAVVHNNYEVIQILVDHGVNINAQVNGSTPLNLAARYGSKNAAEILLEKGANLKQADNNGLLPTHTAALTGNIDVLKVILNYAPNLINIKSGDATNRFSLLHFAIEKNYQDIIKYLLTDRNVDINIKNVYNDVPLSLAARKGNLQIVQYLSNHKNIVTDTFNSYGETPLHLAALSGNFDMIKYLIDDIKLNPQKRSKFNGSVLHYAAMSGNFQLVTYLLKEQNIACNVEDSSGYTPLEYAIWYNHSDIINLNKCFNHIVIYINEIQVATLSGDLNTLKYVISKSDYKDYNVFLPALFGFEGIVRYLIDEKNVNFIYPDFPSIVYHASLSGNVSLMKYFIEEKHLKDNDTYTYDSVLLTPLCFTALSGNLEAVKYLVEERGISVNVNSPFHFVPVTCAVASGNLEIIKYLIEQKRADLLNAHSCTPKKIITLHDLGIQNSLNAYCTSDFTQFTLFTERGTLPLFSCAVKTGRLDVVKYFFDHRIVTGDTGSTLIDAVQYNNLDVVKYLVEEKNADIYIKDKSDTPLLLLAANDLDVIKYFIDDRHMDPCITGRNGSTLLHFGSQTDLLNVVKYLIEDERVNINIKDNDATTPLMVSALNKSHGVLKYLVAKGADIKVKNSFGLTALHFAAKATHFPGDILEDLNSVKCLVENGADVNAIDNNGRTPLDYALDIQEDIIVPYLISKGAHHGSRSISKRGSNIETKTKLKFNLKNTFQNTMSNLTEPNKYISYFYYPTINNNNSSSNPASEVSYIQNVGDNSTILLLDVMIRKISGKKYVSQPDTLMSLKEAKSRALNIVTELEKIVNKVAKVFEIEEEDINISYFDLYRSIEKKILSGKENEIPNMLLETLQQSELQNIKNQKKFQIVLQLKIKQMLDKFFPIQNDNVMSPVVNLI